MIDKLPCDIIYEIIYILDNIHDVINFASLNKKTHIFFDNKCYTFWGRHIYTNIFWDKAILRPIILSKPLPNMRLELLRLNNFDNHNKKYGFEIWKIEDYYKYWKAIEKNLL